MKSNTLSLDAVFCLSGRRETLRSFRRRNFENDHYLLRLPRNVRGDRRQTAAYECRRRQPELPGVAAGERAIPQTHDQPVRRGFLSIRDGDWKYIAGLGSGGFTKPNKNKGTKNGPKGQLFNLREDPSETTDLYSEKPALVKRLNALLEKQKSAGRSTTCGSERERVVTSATEDCPRLQECHANQTLVGVHAKA